MVLPGMGGESVLMCPIYPSDTTAQTGSIPGTRESVIDTTCTCINLVPRLTDSNPLLPAVGKTR